MEVRELKFLLKLAGLPGQKGKISEIKPNSKAKIADTEKICRQLRDRAFVACEEEITQFQISSVGKASLKLNLNKLPLTAEEVNILKACSQTLITPQNLKITPVKTRNAFINSLLEKGLITIVATKIKQVWLTDIGKKYLLQEYNPQGNYPVLSLHLLKNYLSLFRQNYLFSNSNPEIVNHNNLQKQQEKVAEQIANREIVNSDWVKSTSQKQNGKVNHIDDRELLKTIVALDRQLGTDNYLPIFYLRERLQSFVSREELDLALYRLQRQDKLELSSIVESAQYTREQLQAGIPQNIGGCLFFLIVNLE